MRLGVRVLLAGAGEKHLGEQAPLRHRGIGDSLEQAVEACIVGHPAQSSTRPLAPLYEAATAAGGQIGATECTTMKTVFLLMAQYDARAVIPIEWVARDFFSHLTADNLVRKISAGDIALPLVRMEDSARSAKGVALIDLAAYIDRRVEVAQKECRQLAGHILR